MKLYKQLYFLPNGKQEISAVSETALGYRHAHLIMWDERIDGPLVYDANNFGGLVRSNGVLVLDQAKKDAHDAIIAAKQAAKDSEAQKLAQFKQIAENFKADLQAAATLGAVKQVVGQAMIRIMHHLIKKGD